MNEDILNISNNNPTVPAIFSNMGDLSEAEAKARLRDRLLSLRSTAIAEGMALLSSEEILAEKDSIRRR